MADISTTDGSLIRISGQPMNQDNIRDEDEEEDLVVTDDDLNTLEDQRLLDEGNNTIPEAIGCGIDDCIERPGQMSQGYADLTLKRFEKPICSLPAEEAAWIRQAMPRFREIRDSMHCGSNQAHDLRELQADIGKPKVTLENLISHEELQPGFWCVAPAVKSAPGNMI
jgi:hypothetical protein